MRVTCDVHVAGVRRALQPRASAPGARSVRLRIGPRATVTAPERGPSRGSADARSGCITSSETSRRVTFGRTTFSGRTALLDGCRFSVQRQQLHRARTRRRRTHTSSRSTAGCSSSSWPSSSPTACSNAQVLLEDWRIEPNSKRPHSSLGWLAPAAYVEALARLSYTVDSHKWWSRRRGVPSYP